MGKYLTRMEKGSAVDSVDIFSSILSWWLSFEADKTHACLSQMKI